MKNKHDEQHNNSMFKGAPPSSFGKAKELRQNMTPAESLLWERLKGKKLNGLKFRRQHPIHLYIADFYCHKLKLIIELDGEYHLTKDQKLKDEERTKVLEAQGISVIRFKNEEVINDIESVLKKILEFKNE